VAPALANTDDAPAGHVLASGIARTLDDGAGAGVAHREAPAGQPAEERAPAGRAVEHGVADDHVLVRLEVRSHPHARAHRDDAAGEPLAHVIMRVAGQRERDPWRQPATEALPGRALELDHDRLLAEAGFSVHARDEIGRAHV